MRTYLEFTLSQKVLHTGVQRGSTNLKGPAPKATIENFPKTSTLRKFPIEALPPKCPKFEAPTGAFVLTGVASIISQICLFEPHVKRNLPRNEGGFEMPAV